MMGHQVHEDTSLQKLSSLGTHCWPYNQYLTGREGGKSILYDELFSIIFQTMGFDLQARLFGRI